MILLDSNIVIYLRDPAWGQSIRDKIGNQRLATCNIIRAEVLGYKGLTHEDVEYFEQLFVAMKKFQFDDAVTMKTIELRRSMSIQLPDAIIAATASVNGLELWTRNLADYKVPELAVFDPVGEQE